MIIDSLVILFKNYEPPRDISCERSILFITAVLMCRKSKKIITNRPLTEQNSFHDRFSLGQRSKPRQRANCTTRTFPD